MLQCWALHRRGKKDLCTKMIGYDPNTGHARSAVMSISIQPWHGPVKMSVCMTPASVPLAWGV